MLYSKEKSFLFIHIPKTAGTSIRSVLAPYSGKSGVLNYIGRRLEKYPVFCFKTGLSIKRTYDSHTTYERLENILPQAELNRIFKFCVVRNPYDRAYSFYLHVLSHPTHNLYKLIESYGSFGGMLQNLEVVGEPTQKSYIINLQADISVDFIGKFESLNDDFNAVCKKLGIPYELPKKNTRKHKDYRDAYDEQNWKYIAEYYSEDFDAFGYDKDLLK
ncbi:sulfotransferase family protein [Cryomorpha ignava]|uniref:Sulfotransferase family protein n=1 Tax=Cryomorpha ignava TaxID=101383 RepID=A0A7K3WMJ5_9FLAO|nr:sulfotransferase family 2 domain-containing protein [Cryomorpha ignava]NEN22748.1 sulfotransferase family protein [Cryomorpha ignava]